MGPAYFMLLNTGAGTGARKNGLLNDRLGYKFGDQKPAFTALEGSIAVTGRAVQWLRDNLGIISESSETEALARQVADNGGIYFVPAFSGLFAPYWEATPAGSSSG